MFSEMILEERMDEKKTILVIGPRPISAELIKKLEDKLNVLEDKLIVKVASMNPNESFGPNQNTFFITSFPPPVAVLNPSSVLIDKKKTDYPKSFNGKIRPKDKRNINNTRIIRGRRL